MTIVLGVLALILIWTVMGVYKRKKEALIESGGKGHDS
ncbi:hypothetical protein BMS3Bbin09_01531 [bacterium BMS3Bbin09]|nr:hypothetical protein BMS3Bbin09_01531 [bacterium BMS3Bbin09]